MMITFDNDNNVIIYALKKIISFARNNHYIFLALSIWWISSLIGLQQGLAIHINDLKERTEIIVLEAILKARNTICNIDMNHHKRILLVTPQDIQEDSRPHDKSTSAISSDVMNNNPADQILDRAERFIENSE